jgi:hypothetical protein
MALLLPTGLRGKYRAPYIYDIAILLIVLTNAAVRKAVTPGVERIV